MITQFIIACRNCVENNQSPGKAGIHSEPMPDGSFHLTIFCYDCYTAEAVIVDSETFIPEEKADLLNERALIKRKLRNKERKLKN